MKITIPPAAWKAAMVAYHSSVKLGPDEAWQAACLAMLYAWPDTYIPSKSEWSDNPEAMGKNIILPLPKDDTQSAFSMFPVDDEHNWGDQ